MGFPSWINEWIKSFLTERFTTLMINGTELEAFELLAGVLQGSPLSVILYLLYTEEIIRLYNKPNVGIYGIGFVDDINVLVYGPSTGTNCAKLAKVNDKCLEWASRHGIKFNPTKYELIYFTTATNRHNLNAKI
jgi:hypothetical protein